MMDDDDVTLSNIFPDCKTIKNEYFPRESHSAEHFKQTKSQQCHPLLANNQVKVERNEATERYQTENKNWKLKVTWQLSMTAGIFVQFYLSCSNRRSTDDIRDGD